MLYITNSGVKNSYGLYGPWLEDGTFSRSTLPKGAASFIEKGSEEKLATVTRLVPRSQAETVVNIDETLVLQEPVIEPSAEAMTNPVDKKMAESSTENIVEFTKNSIEDKPITENRRRRFPIPPWLIVTVAGASLAIPVAIVGVHQGPQPVPTPSTSPSDGPISTTTTEPGAPRSPGVVRPITADEYIYNILNNITVSGQSLTSVDGSVDQLTTLGTPNDIYVRNRLGTVEQPIPQPAIKPKVTSFEVMPGQGGEALLRGLGKDPSRWYSIANTLAQDYPSYFYAAGGDVRINHSGPVPSDIIATIERILP